MGCTVALRMRRLPHPQMHPHSCKALKGVAGQALSSRTLHGSTYRLNGSEAPSHSFLIVSMTRVLDLRIPQEAAQCGLGMPQCPLCLVASLALGVLAQNLHMFQTSYSCSLASFPFKCSQVTHGMLLTIVFFFATVSVVTMAIYCLFCA